MGLRIEGVKQTFEIGQQEAPVYGASVVSNQGATKGMFFDTSTYLSIRKTLRTLGKNIQHPDSSD
jgi:hypothetical protein